MQPIATCAPPTSPILERIRRHTRDLHTSVEDKLPLLRGDLDLTAYQHYLQMTLGFHRPLEGALRAAMRAEGAEHLAPRQWKTPLLIADLVALDGSATPLPAVAGRLYNCRDLPVLAGRGAILGCLYVLEGATLGGQVLYRQLSPALPASLSVASRYLRCYGAETGANWRAFTALLAAHDDGGTMSGEMVTAAAATFAALLRWIDTWEAA